MSIEEFFGAEITEEIKVMVRRRLLDGGNLASRGCDRHKAKLSLLLLLELNPSEVLFADEAALLYGLSADTVSKRQKLRELYVKVNVGK